MTYKNYMKSFYFNSLPSSFFFVVTDFLKNCWRMWWLTCSKHVYEQQAARDQRVGIYVGFVNKYMCMCVAIFSLSDVN